MFLVLHLRSAASGLTFRLQPAARIRVRIVLVSCGYRSTLRGVRLLSPVGGLVTVGYRDVLAGSAEC
jgi:hypothetical protein